MSISDLETGTYTDVNAAFLSVTGFTRDEVIGKSSLELGFWVNPDDRKTLVAGTITKGYPTGVELKMRVKGGQVRAVVIWTRVMDVGGTKHLFTVAKDVTDEEAPGRKIRESEERLRSLADNLPQVAVYRLRYSPENPPRFEYLSAGIERIVGISPEKAMKDASFLYRLVEHDDLMGLMAAEAHSHANATPLECEIRMRHAVTGTTAWVVLRATHLRTKEGCTVWSGVMVDVTEKKMAEHDLLPVDYNCCL
jgi:PAS domain S-box-containing protein